MNGIALMVMLSTLGVDQGWRSTSEGQLEYVLQVEPLLFDALLGGEVIASQLPSDVQRVDRICIRIGNGKLDDLGEQAPDWPDLAVPAERRASDDPADVAPLTIHQQAEGKAVKSYDLTHGWQPDTDKESQYIVQIDPTFLRSLREGDELYTNVQPEAGPLSSIVITAGRKSLPRETARPPITTVAQLQPREPRGTSVTDEPAYTDLTEGSVYGPAPAAREVEPQPGEQPPRAWNINDAGTRPAPDGQLEDQGQAGSLQPPTSPLLEVPQFDRSQFSGGASPAGARPSTSRPSTSRPSTRPTTNPYASQQRQPQTPSYPPDENVAPVYDEDPGVRTAARTSPTRSSADDTSRRPAFRSEGPSQENPEFPGWVSFLIFCALCLSIGGNLYLGWTAAEFYSRYRLAIERLRTSVR